jgi:DNA topoisomerase IB
MPRKPLDLPPAAARAFVKDMRAFHAAATGFEKDEIAARQLHALREQQRPGEKLRLIDVHEMFQEMKDQAREALRMEKRSGPWQE